jgi:hypothetical protein
LLSFDPARKKGFMRLSLLVLLACAPAIPVFAQASKTNAQPAKAATASDTAAAGKETPGLTFPASAGTVKAPFILTNDCLYQPDIKTELNEDGGKATYNFTITNAGEYVIHATVNAPGEDSNSFFLNIDAQPEDPLTIWDIDVTSGFEERVVNWRGDGAADSDQFAPKRFKLAAGKHQLIIIGREPETQLKSLSIRPAPPAPAK